MNRLLFIPLLLFVLVGCSASASGIDRSLFKDGKNIIQMTNSNIDSGKLRYTDDQKMLLDDFDAKYTSNLDDYNEEEIEFNKLVRWSTKSYMEYGLYQEEKHLEEYHEYLSDLESKFNMDVD
jgi:hypothetical protein